MEKVILVEPEIPENTGFIARLSSNFGLEMRLVSPEFNLSEARETASRAQSKLRSAEIFDSVEEAVEDLDYVVGSKAERGIDVEEFQPRRNTSIMIGRESSGLSSAELELCDAVVHIGTEDYPSLNQSHAAAVLFHSMKSSEDPDSGIQKSKKQVLKGLLPEMSYRALIRSNPSTEEVDAIIGELKDYQDQG